MAGPFRILVVEDEPVIRELVRSLLTDVECEVETAPHAADGLKLAKTQTFDLILLDVVLPPVGSIQLDGIAVCRMLRADPRTAKTPIYMLTAKAKKTDVEIAMKAGASGYIHKPFRGAELMELVQQLKAKLAAS
ncbi:MAG: two-component system response regulator [Archangium gephyra]|uniref:Two-component system response regulator n=1 Tax=Archangium gephyra TaxID=48 RepID=A0A2W5T5I1_9BACT|nr:MAG: two-component system response regulator [Archangium gephyra]